MSFDEGLESLQALKGWYSGHAGERNEATTRRHLVDKILFGCLGWRDEDAVLEDRIVDGRGFADYTFSLPRPVLIVEAKREGQTFELPAGPKQVERSLSSLCRNNQRLKEAVQQVGFYCYRKGVQFAAVTNGHQLVAFVAISLDGSDPLAGKAFVFDSIDHMLENFQSFWNVLSRDGIAERRLLSLTQASPPVPPPPKLATSIPGYPGFKNRNPFQAEIKAVAELILEDLTRTSRYEGLFLDHCYSETGALAQYSYLGKAILGARYAALFDSANPGPSATPLSESTLKTEALAEGYGHRPVLLIGDVGVGKTTFLKHMLHTADEQIKERCIFLYLDLGSSFTITTDIKKSIMEELKEQLRLQEGDVEADEFVRAAYHGELLRFGRSVQKRIRESNPTLYREREVKFLEQKLEFPEKHLKVALEHIVKGRGKQIVIALDNCDQRSAETQELVFLIAQEMASAWPALVFVSLRPETFHASRRRGALTAYHTRAFTISPPRLDDVIRKRLNFGLRITGGEIPLGTEYGPITARLSNLDVLMRVFLESLERNLNLFECIENVSGSNVRLALLLIYEFFGSGHVDTRKLVRVREDTGSYTIPLHEFLRAIIFGDAAYYDPSQSPVMNVFDVSSHDRREHFLVLVLLSILRDLTDVNVEKGFVETARVYDMLQAIGFLPQQIDSGIVRCVKSKLVETVARILPASGEPVSPRLRITSVGVYHLFRLPRQFTYVDAIVVDTPVFDPAIRSSITDTHELNERIARVQAFAGYLDATWQEGTLRWFDWTSAAKDLRFNCGQVARSAEKNLARRAEEMKP